ncbi:MAG TPA: glycerol-3-phosphate acyltransferase [Candidatus Limnocylindrales bacterium]|nr:glycerol-3-phosphate acyltransferase [Candidatus Limnocylindrales bacterium]
MDLGIAIGAALVGYLLGSLSFARLAVRLSGKPVDLGNWEVRLPGGETWTSSIVSATSVRLALGPRYGCLVSMLDMAKVAIPTLAFRLLWPGEPYLYIAAAAGVVGHDFPVFYRFHGGHGESAILGGLLVIDPVALVGTTILGFGVGFLAGSILVVRWAGFLLLVPWLWVSTGSPWAIAYIVVVLALYFGASARDFRQYRGIVSRGTIPTNEQIAAEIGMGRGLGRALDRYGLLPALLRAVRGTGRRPASAGDDDPGGASRDG